MERALFSKLVLIMALIINSAYAIKLSPNVLGMHESKIDVLTILQQDDFDFNELVVKAKRRDIDAQIKLADILYHGNDLIRDEQRAIQWWLKVAKKNHVNFKKSLIAKANFRLGKYYFNEDSIKALEFLNKATRLGHSEAQMMVFMMRQAKTDKEQA